MIFALTNHHPVVSTEAFKRFLRYPVRRPFTDALTENATWAEAWFAAHARPWLCAQRLSAGEVVVAASAGPEAEAEASRRWQDGEPDRYYFLECYASAAVEALLLDAMQRLSGWASENGLRLGSRWRSPGHAGLPITDNLTLVPRLTQQGLPGPLHVLPSGMLAPKKSQLAVVPLIGAARVRRPELTEVSR